jgi:hypothetical protein
MRLVVLLLVTLVFAAPAAAAAPRFALFDLHDLGRASHNAYGDVKVSKRHSPKRRVSPAATSSPRRRTPAASAGVDLGLNARGRSRWTAFAKLAAQRAKSSGVPDVFVVVVEGSILALPYANDVRHKNGTVELVGFTRAGALHMAKTLG